MIVLFSQTEESRITPWLKKRDDQKIVPDDLTNIFTCAQNLAVLLREKLLAPGSRAHKPINITDLNGDIGVVIGILEGKVRSSCETAARFADFADSETPNAKLAVAFDETVHVLLGPALNEVCDYKDVILDLHNRTLNSDPS